MIMSSKQGNTIRFQLSETKTYTLVAFAIITTLSIITASIYTAKKSLEISNYKKIKAESTTQKEKITELSDQINNVKKEIEYLIETEVRIRDVMRQKNKSSPRVLKQRTTYRIGQFNQSIPIVDTPQEPSLDQLLQKTDVITQKLTDLKNRYTTFTLTLEKYQKRFASTPSIWPVYGRIRSDFGWRVHPITGRSHFHKGLDIPSWIGAPIKAAADGKAIVTGLRGGYGLVVVIDHGYGFMTIYAHASKILVKRNQLVKKGQIIANVGSTGLSTGPHLHYEIRRWNQSVAPRQFLDLDLFTASKKIW